jgi:glutaredoxin-related protein
MTYVTIMLYKKASSRIPRCNITEHNIKINVVQDIIKNFHKIITLIKGSNHGLDEGFHERLIHGLADCRGRRARVHEST